MCLCVYKCTTDVGLKALQRHVQNYQQGLPLRDEITNNSFLQSLFCILYNEHIFLLCQLKKKQQRKAHCFLSTPDHGCHPYMFLTECCTLEPRPGTGPDPDGNELSDLISDLNPSQAGSIRNLLDVKFHSRASAVTMALQALVRCTHDATAICPHVLLTRANHHTWFTNCPQGFT